MASTKASPFSLRLPLSVRLLAVLTAYGGSLDEDDASRPPPNDLSGPSSAAVIASERPSGAHEEVSITKED
jgi:hypothetical protein